jgi:leucyl aminopeptidase
MLEVKVDSAGASGGKLNAIGIPAFSADHGPEVLSIFDSRIGGAALADGIDPAWCERQGFKGMLGQTVVVATSVEGPSTMLVGLGPRRGFDAERWRQAAAAFVRANGGRSPLGFALPQPDASVGLDPVRAAAAVTVGAVLAAYRFAPYRTIEDPERTRRLVLLGPDDDPDLASSLGLAVERANEVAGAVSFARDLANRPASDLNPRQLAEAYVGRFASIPQITVEVWDEARIADERLGALEGVARGSDQPPRLVWARYEPATEWSGPGDVPHVILVGKGITFDSGGLSLKPPDGMIMMKTDMSGSSVVMATLSACATLDVRIRVSALAPITENMPGPRALKPGDVLRARNGLSIEVLNTDAEGRLVLADALSLATEEAPSAIIDVATLTGAASVALGSSIGALFGTDETLVRRVQAAAAAAGEGLWQLPLPEQYRDHIDSDIADMKNVGKAGAGAIVAALLLERFTGGIPWVHLDVAGPARSAEASGYLTKGATGFGVRTLLALLTTWDSAGIGANVST